MTTERSRRPPPVDRSTESEPATHEIARVEIEVTETEREALETAADLVGLPVPEWIRVVALRAAGALSD